MLCVALQLPDHFLFEKKINKTQQEIKNRPDAVSILELNWQQK